MSHLHTTGTVTVHVNAIALALPVLLRIFHCSLAGVQTQGSCGISTWNDGPGAGVGMGAGQTRGNWENEVGGREQGVGGCGSAGWQIVSICQYPSLFRKHLSSSPFLTTKEESFDAHSKVVWFGHFYTVPSISRTPVNFSLSTFSASAHFPAQSTSFC